MPRYLFGCYTLTDGNTSSLGDWRNTICFVADDEDGALHLDQSNNLANFLSSTQPVYNLDKIYIDAYSQVSTPVVNVIQPLMKLSPEG
ncbi:MAG: hypothetical protein IPL22_13440 [Bacteroidetes bacterium]|nr:hypothetical protein [Bacteroidota bacterium]